MATSGTGGKVLGLGCGQPHGSAEILLKAALRAAEDEGAGVELVRLDELRLPSGAAEAAEPDDAWWLWERLVECDGLIVSTPIISRTVAARLKLLGDRLLGPNADAAIIAGLLALRWLSSWLENGRWYLFGIYCLLASCAVFYLHHIGY